MKNRWVLTGMLLLLAGCSPLEEAYYVDREFGKANQAAWDAQVLYPDYRYADRLPTGVTGINAEEIMNINNKSFAEKPKQSKIYEFDFKGSR